MAGVLMHSLHYLLLVGGLIGVAALLAPDLVDGLGERLGLTRTPVYRPPATAAEHDQRVAALREAAGSGLLTAAPLTTTRPQPRRGGGGGDRDHSPWRLVAVSSSLGAAGVHAAMFPHHALEEGFLTGLFFLVVTLAQGWWAWRAISSVTVPLLVVGALGNLAVTGVWAWSRTTGLPWGLTEGPEAVGAWDLFAVFWQLVLVCVCLRAAYAVPARTALPLGRPDPPATTVPGFPVDAQLHLRLTWIWLVATPIALLLLSLFASHD